MMDKSRQWAFAAVVFVVLLVVVLKTTVRAREGEAPGPPEASVASSQGEPSASQDSAAGAASESATAEAPRPDAAAASSSSHAPSQSDAGSSAKKLPKLLELGSVSCHACQQMQPIIDELKAELKGKVDVEFIDVVRHGDVADKYGIQVIPTQIFLDAEGRELFRHVGVYPKEEILAKMKELKMLR